MQVLGTREAAAWVQQFDPADRNDAIQLLESLHLASADRFTGEMRRLVHSAVAGHEPPIAVYAVREVEPTEEYFGPGLPNPVTPGREVGSEGTLANLATVLSRGNPGRFLNHPPLDLLRDRRCHDVVLLDDLAGSGSRVVKYLRAMRRSRTVRSWCSYGLLRFHLVAYAASEQAERLLRSEFGRRKGQKPVASVSVAFARRPTAGTDRLSDDQRERLVQLCKRYGKRAKIPSGQRLGFGHSMCSIVFAHGCPNNAPGILWRGTNRWTALFPGRVVPASVLGAAATGSGAQPGGVTGQMAEDDPRRGELARVLYLLRRRIRGVERLASILDVSVPECRDLLQACIRYRLIDGDEYITDLGRSELRRAERAGTFTPVWPARRDVLYIPTQLRAARVGV
jgi:hypothetical protein